MLWLQIQSAAVLFICQLLNKQTETVSVMLDVICMADYLNSVGCIVIIKASDIYVFGNESRNSLHPATPLNNRDENYKGNTPKDAQE